MNLIENVKEIEAKYHAGQNIFRRPSVGLLLERISQLEQAAQQSVNPTVLCTCKLPGLDANNPAICPTCGKPQASETYTVDQLKEMGMVGVYSKHRLQSDVCPTCKGYKFVIDWYKKTQSVCQDCSGNRSTAS